MAYGRGANDPATFRDGTSNTLCFAERLIAAAAAGEVDEVRGNYTIGESRSGEGSATPRTLADACEAAAAWQEPWPGGWQGEKWCFGHGDDRYVHNLVPNGPSCDRFLYTASSNHRGGLHGLLIDGSVRFFSESIDRPVWQALGTRAGGELFSL